MLQGALKFVQFVIDVHVTAMEDLAWNPAQALKRRPIGSAGHGIKMFWLTVNTNANDDVVMVYALGSNVNESTFFVGYEIELFTMALNTVGGYFSMYGR